MCDRKASTPCKQRSAAYRSALHCDLARGRVLHWIQHTNAVAITCRSQRSGLDEADKGQLNPHRDAGSPLGNADWGMNHVSTDEYPLDGVVVLECSTLEGVQYAGRLLASLGANVIKVEPPEGDPLRGRPPFLQDTDGRQSSVFFEAVNAGKSSVVLDLTDDASVKHVTSLAQGAHVVLADREQARVLDQLLDVPAGQVRVIAGGTGGTVAEPFVESSFARFHASTSGYLIPADKDPSFRPASPPPLVFEAIHGTCIAVAVAVELLRGVGGEIDYSFQAYGLWLDKMNIHQVSVAGQELHRTTHAYPFGGNMRCRDGYVCIFVIEEHQWRSLCRLTDHPEWLDDPRLADGVTRRQHQDLVDPVLLDWCAERLVDEVIDQARAADVPVARVREMTDVLEWDIFGDRGFFQSDVTNFGPLLGPQLPFGAGLRSRPLGPAPKLGSDAAVPADEAVPPKARKLTRRTSPIDDVTATSPLAGIRVLDFTWAAAGPAVTSIMAILGADVAKVELRSRPDLLRVASKQYGFGGDMNIDASPGFNEIAAAKRSIELDLRNPKDRETALQLAAQADVVIENMRPGKIEALGLSYEELARVNPRVVMCSQSATGRTPRLSPPGYAPIFWAESGAAYLTGWPDQRPGVVRGPVDKHAACFALLGVLGLLHTRERTGKGGYIDCSAIETVVCTLADQLFLAQLGQHPGRVGNAWPGNVLTDVFPCAGFDQWIALSLHDEADVEAVADELKIRELTVSLVLSDVRAAYDLIASRTEKVDVSRLEGRLISRGVSATRSLSLIAATQEARLTARGTWQEVDTTLGMQRMAGLPWTIDGSVYKIKCGAPRLGEHRDEILKEWLGDQ